MRALIGVMALVAAGVVHAAPVTIDFEEFALWDEAPVESQGFRVSGGGPDSREGPLCCAATIVGSASDKAFNAYSFSADQTFYGDPFVDINVRRIDNAAFALYSLDLSGDTDTIYAHRASDDALISGTVADLGQGDWLAITRFSLSAVGFAPPAGFGGQVEITVDNIVVGAAVPVPAAVWLFGSALGFLVAKARRN